MTTDTTTEPDVSKLEKIRGLLDKAERTDFPDEAEALTTKAIEMMETYRITEAMVADARPAEDRGKIIEKRMNLGSGPYVNARLRLAEQIGKNHSVKVLHVTSYRGKTAYLIGYETDVELTEMLYTSLLVQATRAAYSPEVRATKPGYEHGTAFTRSFLLGFAYRIGALLEATNDDAAEDTDNLWTPDDRPSSSRSVALVLADRYKDVEEDVLRRYGKIRTANAGTGSSSAQGTIAGSAAADRADLSTNRRVGAQKAISA